MLTPPERDRLLKLLAMFSSDRMGERAAASAAAHRLAQRLRGWDKLIVLPVQPHIPPPPPPDHAAERARREARDTLRRRDWAATLTDPELDVVLAVAATDEPTEAQQRALARIIAKIRTAFARGR